MTVATITAAVLAFSGCGDDVELPPGGTTTTTGSGGGTGSGGDMTTTTTSSGTGGMGQGGAGQGGAGGGPTCPGLGDDCTNCTAAQCQDTYCACFNNPACVAIVQCIQGCAGDDACVQDCLTQNSDGASDAILLGDCTAESCDVECPGAGPDLPPCYECTFEQCSTEMNTCFANPECAAIILCAQACPAGDQTCVQDCVVQHPGGVTDAQAVLTCSNTNCQAQCQ
jgi:hypothetical protein